MLTISTSDSSDRSSLSYQDLLDISQDLPFIPVIFIPEKTYNSTLYASYYAKMCKFKKEVRNTYNESETLMSKATFSVENSKLGPSTIASTGQAS